MNVKLFLYPFSASSNFVDIKRPLIIIMLVNEFTSASASYLDRYHVQQTHTQSEITAEINAGVSRNFTMDGLGQNGSFQNIPKDVEYQLKTAEYLLINYTNNSKDDSGNETKTVINEKIAPAPMEDAKTIAINPSKIDFVKIIVYSFSIPALNEPIIDIAPTQKSTEAFKNPKAKSFFCAS